MKFIPRKTKFEEPIISLRDDRFHYSSYFSKIAGLNEKNFVCYHIYEDSYEIGFEFLSENIEGAYKLGIEQNKKHNYRSSAGQVISSFPWIKEFHDINDNESLLSGKKKLGREKIPALVIFRKIVLTN